MEHVSLMISLSPVHNFMFTKQKADVRLYYGSRAEGYAAIYVPESNYMSTNPCFNLLHLVPGHPLIEVVIVFQTNLLHSIQLSTLIQVVQCTIPLQRGTVI